MSAKTLSNQLKGSVLSLFASSSTLICCALPALLVSIGAGSTLVSLIGVFPFLITLSKYKALTFGISGSLIALSALYQYLSRNAPCPLDPELAKQCGKARKLSRIVLAFSALIWMTGFLFAFVLPALKG